MKPKHITWEQLRHLLLNLGFDERVDQHMIYQHACARGAYLGFALHAMDEDVSDYDLTKTRTVLYWTGLMEHEAFDQWVVETKYGLKSSEAS